ncbi:MAG TPA: hypothetical protein QGH10_10845 [Armatimonadota bacterium]|nr:hypothetical protein [Armatimonadota bacterium]
MEDETRREQEDGCDQHTAETPEAPKREKPSIRKVDESRHGDFWCD